MGIEPSSLTAVFCVNAANRKAATWEKRLEPFDRLEFAVSDAAKGIASAVAAVAEARRDAPQAPPLEHGLDRFHTTMEARRVLARHWRRAQAAWEQAEAADHSELSPRKRRAYDRIAAVLKDTFRASSAVECLNSVLRMQPSRHRRMTQSMLNLKRLSWNYRAFRSGPRKNTSPDQALGLPLPPFDFWGLLQTDPARLTQQLSTQGNAA